MSGQEKPALLTTGEVAAMLRVDSRTVSRWAKAGKITAIITPGGTRRIPADQISRILNEEVPR